MFWCFVFYVSLQENKLIFINDVVDGSTAAQTIKESSRLRKAEPMAKTARFSFGYFSDEEHNNYLKDPSSVELPLSWSAYKYETNGEFRSKDLPDDSHFENYTYNSAFQNENPDHVMNEAICSDKNFNINELGLNSGIAANNPEKCVHKVNGIKSHQVLNVMNEASKTDVSTVDIRKETSQLENKIVNGHADIESKAAMLIREKKNANPSSKLPSIVGELPKDRQKQSWASLFTGTSQTQKHASSVPLTISPKVTQIITPPNHSARQRKKQPAAENGILTKPSLIVKVVNVEKDPFSRQVAEQISKNEIVYRSPGLMPRGFINSSNWCYINATLQALLTSSPFCHLMRSLPSRPLCAEDNIIFTSTPIMDSFVKLVKELKPLPKKSFQRNASKDQFHGTSYKPDYIYKMLSTIESKFSEPGRQEDAEEFLSCVLNGLHEEMLRVTEFYYGKAIPTKNQDDSQIALVYEVPLHNDKPVNDLKEDQDQWEEVTATRKNRSSVMRRADISKTPVSDVFRGELRSDLLQEGQRSTATLEPFFTLPLDINDQNTWSVNEALEHLARLERVQDFTNSKTKTKVEATRRLSLQTLPPVLILHLKRFIYDKEGGSLKIDKEVQYHTDLVIGKELLSKSSKKVSQGKRTYKLFAVVYHHGKTSTGGHYTTDVYHDGLSCWLRIDDQHIKITNVHEVVRHNPQRTAYLLYYKRTDLMAV